jgi:hypothetical protein
VSRRELSDGRRVGSIDELKQAGNLVSNGSQGRIGLIAGASLARAPTGLRAGPEVIPFGFDGSYV